MLARWLVLVLALEMLLASACLFVLVLFAQRDRISVHHILALFAKVALHRAVSATCAIL